MVRFLFVASAFLAFSGGMGYRVNTKEMMKLAETLNDNAGASVTKNILTSQAFSAEPISDSENQSLQEAKSIKAKRDVWEPKGVVAKLGLLRVRTTLYLASHVLPASFFENIPALAGEEIISTEPLPYFGIPSNSIEGLFIWAAYLTSASLVVLGLIRLYGKVQQGRQEEVANVDDNDDFGSIFGDALGFAVPALIGGVLGVLNEVVSTMAMGHAASTVEMAAHGVCMMLNNCTIMAFCMPIVQVMDTVVSQAFGAGDTHLCLVYLQRCRFFCCMHFLWIIPLFFNAEAVLLLFGQDPEVVAIAAFPMKIWCLSGFLCIHSMATFSFQRNRGDVMSGLWIGLVSNLTQVICVGLFVVYFKGGATGAALTMLVQNFLSGGLFFHHTLFRTDAGQFGVQKLMAFTPEAFSDLWTYLALAIPSTVSQCADSWFWEINAVMLGWIGPVALASHSSTNSFNFVVSTGAGAFAGAGCTLVARAFGSGKVRRARAITIFTLSITIGLWSIFSLPMFLFSPFIANVFNSNPAVQRNMTMLLHCLGRSGYMLFTQGLANAVLKAMARQRVVAITHFCVYYIIAIPLGYYLAFPRNFGIAGVYNAFGVGISIAAAVFVNKLGAADFAQVCQETKERLAKDVANAIQKKPSEKVEGTS